MDTDFLLIRKMRQGEEEAFDAFVHKYYGEILQYCNWHCFDRGYAEDLTQETFLRFFAGFSSYEHRGKAKQYLYTIAGNLCKNFYKKKKEYPADREELEGSRQSGEADPAGRLVEKVAVEQALAQHPEELYEVAVLHYFQGLKLKETAEMLGISLPLVKYRIRQAKEKLEELLGKEEKR